MTQSTDTVPRAAGPIGRLVTTGYPIATGANALILLRRVAFVTRDGEQPDKAEAGLLRWAVDHDLGQDGDMVHQVAARRERTLQTLTASGRYAWRRLQVSPQWRLAAGLGNRANPYEVGLSLHGTYGWPVIPGSTLKGLTCAWAVE
jgi:CRISPR/Cas system CMR subunit Cmr6 (Cas7 group RAMP superfamily)